LAGSIVFSLSLTSISWLGYLMLENRFTGRLKLFATLPLAPSSYLFGFLGFALAQGALSTATLLIVGRWAGVPLRPSVAPLALVVALTILCLCGLGACGRARVDTTAAGRRRENLRRARRLAPTIPSLLRVALLGVGALRAVSVGTFLLGA